jgi:Laminin B (Domain IV)/RTX calcium-binding nonapeptide repeat (4 copies)
MIRNFITLLTTSFHPIRPRRSPARNFIQRANRRTLLELLETRRVFAGDFDFNLLGQGTLGFSGNESGTGIVAVQKTSGYDVYVTGIRDSLSGEGIVAKLGVPDSQGTVVPTWSIGWPGQIGSDSLNGIEAIGNQLFAVGSSYSQTTDNQGSKESKGITVALDATNGGITWEAQTPAASGAYFYGGIEKLNDIDRAIEGGNNVFYVVGSAQIDFVNGERPFLSKVDQSGNVLWTRTDETTSANSGGYDVIAQGGFVYSAGYTLDGGSREVFVKKYDPNGTLIWSQRRGAGVFESIEVDHDSGTLWAVGYDNQSPTNALVEKWDLDGNVQWSRTYPIARSFSGTAFHEGRLFASGTTFTNTAGGSDGIVVELDNVSGDIIQSETWGGTQNDEFTSISVTNRRVHLVGTTSSLGAGGTDIAYVVYQTAPDVQMIVKSSFDTNADGWVVFGDAQNGRHLALHQTDSVTGDGYLLADDDVQGSQFYFRAPLKFLGDQSSAYGKFLDYELSNGSTNSTLDLDSNVVLSDGINTLIFDTANPGTSATSYHIPLVASAGWQNLGNNSPATEAELQSVLANLNHLAILGEFRDGDEWTTIDKVILGIDEDTTTLDTEKPALAPELNVTGSHFETSNEGWLAVVDDANSSMIPSFIATNGSPGGHISISGAAGSNFMQFLAPNNFLGDQSAAFGKYLTFDFKNDLNGVLINNAKDVTLSNGTTTIYVNLANPVANWRSNRIPLDVNGGWKNVSTGTAATATQIQDVLSNLSLLLIQAEHVVGMETSYLDNVVIGALPDIRVLDATATGGSTISVTYEISGIDSVPFSLGFYRSEDRQFGGDIRLNYVTLADQSDLATGTHTKTWNLGTGSGMIRLPGAGLPDLNADYSILVVADPTNSVVEHDPTGIHEDNVIAFTGVYHLAGSSLMIHGTEADDLVVVERGFTISFNDETYAYPATTVSTIRARLHGGDDSLDASTSNKSIFGFGGQGADLFFGGIAADRLNGGAGDDIVFGNDGGDQIYGDLGNDRLVGGKGDDTYWFDADLSIGSDRIEEPSGFGNDSIDYSQTSSMGVVLDLALTGTQTVNANHTLKLVAVNSIEIAVGSSSDDTLYGNSLNNVLIGGLGNDQLFGRAGRDLLVGGSGIDEIHGGAGDDLLISGNLTYFSESTNLLNRVAINEIMLEWTRQDADYTTRLSNLRNGTGMSGASRINSTTVILEDSAIDTLYGSDDLDWFWVDALDLSPDFDNALETKN